MELEKDKLIYKFFNLRDRKEISKDEVRLKQLLKAKIKQRVNFIRSIEYIKRDNFTARLIINLHSGEWVTRELMFRIETLTLELLTLYIIDNLKGKVWWL